MRRKRNENETAASWREGQERDPLEELWQRLTRLTAGGGAGRRLWLIGLGAVVLIWLATGIYIVGPGEQGVVRRFGKEVGKTSSGLNYHLPRPVEKVDVVNMAVIRRAEIGFRTVSSGPPVQYQDVMAEAQMLTGDENIVNTNVVIQYKVKDASQYLFKVRDPNLALHAATEVALRSVVGNATIDDVMTVGRARVQNEVKIILQRLMDSYESGLLITEVRLQEVDAPEEVRDAFQDVVRAREDREKLTREAEGYREDLLPKARGEAAQIVKAAEAYKEQRIIRAQGDAERFLEVLEEYQKAKPVTRRRLYLETIEKVLPGVEKILIDSESSGNLLQFLPLRDLTPPEQPEGGQ